MLKNLLLYSLKFHQRIRLRADKTYRRTGVVSMEARNFEAEAIRLAWESISQMILEDIARDLREPTDAANIPCGSSNQKLIFVYSPQEPQAYIAN